jgi:antitoxin (DNA-binding transcriptional repressor) of toxin-antitoxin stability system
MKTISITQLHTVTGRWVRAAKDTPLVVTDHGEQVAIITAYAPKLRPRPVFSLHGRLRPKVPTDSTVFIAEDRNR